MNASNDHDSLGDNAAFALNMAQNGIVAKDIKPKIMGKIPPKILALLIKAGYNFLPAYRGGGGRIEYISQDLFHIRARLPHSWKTKNMVGTIFGGSLFAVTDGVHMGLLSFKLGAKYVVWDKSAAIRFKRPAYETLYADFILSQKEIMAIKQEIAKNGEVTKNYNIELKDKKGTIYASVEREVYIADKLFHKNKIQAKNRKIDYNL